MTYRAINVMLPTRGRARSGRLTAFLDSLIVQTIDPRAVCVSMLVDADDHETLDYLAERAASFPLTLYVHINRDTADGPHLARYYNRLYDLGSGLGDEVLVSMFGDDMEFCSPGWEQRFLAEANAADGWAIVHGDDDLVQHEKMAVHFVTSRKVVSATGAPFMWERWRANIIDYVWTRVGQDCGLLHYCADVHIAHRHSSRYGADETYHRMDGHRFFVRNREHIIEDYVRPIVASVRTARDRERAGGST